jgi:hypothetical protein
MRKNNDGWVSFAFLIVVVLVGVVVWDKRLAVEDWIKLRNYTAPSTIAALATDDTMTPLAVHDFYINHPDQENAATFNKNCPAGTEKTIVLGCYQSNQRGIFLYNVTDTRLDGVEQVTAAHEMLHAAYDRLSTKKRDYVDGLLEDYYKNDLHDQRLLGTIAAYKKSEPNDVVNEMHSVFGTEVMQLPAALETYYKQYFTDRQKIATYAAAYQGEFVTRQNQVAADDAQLAKLKSAFTADEADLEARNTDLQSLQTQMNTEKQRGQIAEYNANVPKYNAKVDAYNVEVGTVKQLVAQYNQLVVARNAIAVEEQQLSQALNSQAAPIATK